MSRDQQICTQVDDEAGPAANRPHGDGVEDGSVVRASPQHSVEADMAVICLVTALGRDRDHIQ